MTEGAAKRATAHFASKAVRTAGAVGQLIDGVREVAQTVRVIAEQQTARAEIEAKARVEIKKVEAVRDVLLEYLDRSFDERKSAFAALFEGLDTALRSSNVETVAATLDAVVKLAQSSPFKDLADVRAAKAALKDKSRDWKF